MTEQRKTMWGVYEEDPDDLVVEGGRRVSTPFRVLVASFETEEEERREAERRTRRSWSQKAYRVAEVKN